MTGSSRAQLSLSLHTPRTESYTTNNTDRTTLASVASSNVKAITAIISN